MEQKKQMLEKAVIQLQSRAKQLIAFGDHITSKECIISITASSFNDRDLHSTTITDIDLGVDFGADMIKLIAAKIKHLENAAKILQDEIKSH